MTARLLLVEDDPDDAELILLTLRRSGLDFSHCCCRDAVSLEALLRRQEWDLVISDYRLPGLSAHEVVAQVRADARDIPVIVVSGYVGEPNAVSLMKAGASDFVAKEQLARLAPAVERELREAGVRARKRRALAALRDQERFLREVTSAMGEGLLVLDGERRVEFANTEAERLLGWSGTELRGRSLHETVHYRYPDGSERSSVSSPLLDLSSDHPRLMIDDDVCVRRDGTLLPVSWVATYSENDCGARRYVIVVRDRTEQKRAEELMRSTQQQLRELSAHLQTAREEERAHIARELHDELGQLLSSLRLDIDWLQRRLPALVAVPPLSTQPQQPIDVGSRIDAMTGLVDMSLAMVRRIATELRPPIIDDLGLDAAIEWLVEGLRARTELDVRIQLDLHTPELPEAVATAVFRLVQESFTNIVRHAQATVVRLLLSSDHDLLQIRIRDDGVGFAKDESRARSFGLLGMRERVVALQGTFSISSAPGAGCEVVACIPLTESAMREAASPTAVSESRSMSRQGPAIHIQDLEDASQRQFG